jgi:tRNA A37 threonylcarbamoyladenosine synthetase subunit TsaC/SUA5/YrdC
MKQQPKPVTDLSQNVVSLARRLDRLPPGEYTIVLVKPELRGEGWGYRVTRIETLFDLIAESREE